jgi:hypothetical protein
LALASVTTWGRPSPIGRTRRLALSNRHTDHEIAAAERLIAGLINNPTLAPVVAMIGLTVEHFPPGMGLRNSFRFAMAGRDCVAAHVASKHEDLSRQVLRRLAGLRVELTVAEAKALAQHLLDPLAARIAADRRPRASRFRSCLRAREEMYRGCRVAGGGDRRDSRHARGGPPRVCTNSAPRNPL